MGQMLFSARATERKFHEREATKSERFETNFFTNFFFCLFLHSCSLSFFFRFSKGASQYKVHFRRHAALTG